MWAYLVFLAFASEVLGVVGCIRMGEPEKKIDTLTLNTSSYSHTITYIMTLRGTVGIIALRRRLRLAVSIRVG